jgi:hypothetical protein
VFAVFYGWLLLGEQMGMTQLLGVAGVSLGVYVVNSGGAPHPQTLTKIQKDTAIAPAEEVAVSSTR